jgi:hypothetical protein
VTTDSQVIPELSDSRVIPAIPKTRFSGFLLRIWRFPREAPDFTGDCFPLSPCKGVVGSTSVFDGLLNSHPRKQCEREVVERRGTVEDNVTRRTTFLVIGTLSSPDWEQSNYGRRFNEQLNSEAPGFH